MAAVKKTERQTVSMTFRKPWGRYSKGDRAGFPEERAKQLEDRKIAVRSADVKAEENEEKPAGKQTPAKGTEGADKV
ncbi:hypothetical protein SAMN04487958_107197 [Vreelandella subterranea]|uniref:Uncharacterized protein n=1 Tax=Vreelandella subterranea TaxID=416874 RepID=A0A1H9UT17_9GAMM|nr:hypothetical protein [Halomonas subterranea]SES12481.1 hypothetical protein SAMN04487958_107197 [Halomonas subterranea]